MRVEHRDEVPITRSVARAVAILQAFDDSSLEMGVTDLAQATGIDKSTVYRLLHELQQGGLIEQNPETSKYHLGFGLVRLAGLAVQRLELTRIARPHMRELSQLSQETVNLSILTNGEKTINIDGIASPRLVRNVGWIGREMPIHAVSGGKVILAHMPEERVDQIIAGALDSVTEHTITDAAQLRAELEEIRRVGYGIAEEEMEEGLSAVAAPIRNHEGQAIAAIAISGPAFRMPRASLIKLGQAVKQAADAISTQMGYVA